MNLLQSFAWWSFFSSNTTPEDLLTIAADIGFKGVDFLPRELWPQANAIGIEVIIVDGHESLDVAAVGFNDSGNHTRLREQVKRAISIAADHGIRHVAVTAGRRGGLGDADAIATCVQGLEPLVAEAEALGVGILLEPLNSKIEHPDHQCDKTAWGAEVVRMINSPALRLLYDGYHMQIMEGNILQTIETYFPLIGHIHTAGVPGRHDLDEGQEINWPAIASLLHRLEYSGYVGHEFIPWGEAARALKNAFDLFDSPVVVDSLSRLEDV